MIGGRDTVQERPNDSRLAVDRLVSRFATTKGEGLLRYVEFVAAGLGACAPTGTSTTRSVIGDELFDAQIAAQTQPHPEVAKPDRSRLTLEHYAGTSSSTVEAIRAAYASGVHTQMAIARFFGVHYSTISKIVNPSCQDQDSRPDPVTIQVLTP